MTPRALRDLEAKFIRREVRIETYRRVKPEVFAARPLGPIGPDDCYDFTGPVEYHEVVDSLVDADGVIFLCPKCFDDQPIGPVGTHSVICWQPRVPQDVDPKPGRWAFVGSSLDDLTLVAGSSSILLPDTNRCRAHFFVRNGQAVP